MCFFHDDQTLVVQVGTAIEMFDVRTASRSPRVPNFPDQAQVEFARNSDRTCAIFPNGAVEISQAGQLVRRLRIPGDFRSHGVIQDDGTKIALRRHDGMVYVLNSNRLESVDCLQVAENESSEIAFLDSGRSLASVATDGRLRIWHIASGRELLSIDTRLTSPFKIAASADSQYVAVTGKTADFRREFVLYHAPHPASGEARAKSAVDE
jgi:WD40 repeat protein